MALFAALLLTQVPVPVADLPFVHEPGRIWIKGTLNGKPARTMLDTGAGGIVVSEAAAARAGGTKGAAFQANTVGGTSDAWWAGGLIFGLEGAPFQIVATTVIASFAKAKPAALPEVAAGMPLFAGFGVSVDYVAQRVRFSMPGTLSPPAGAVALPLTFKDGVPLVRIGLRMPGGERREVVAMIDTGSPVGAEATRRLARRDGLDRRYASTPVTDQLGGVGGPTKAREVGDVDAEFGGFKACGKGIVDVTEEGATGRDAAYDVLVGDDLLRHFDLGFDYLRSTLWVRPNGK